MPLENGIYYTRTIPGSNKKIHNMTETSNEPDLESKLTKTVLRLERIDKNLFRGSNLWTPTGRKQVFGGQVVGQALVAAGKTKPKDVHIHSMHCYFIRPGNPDLPILYHVERTRDGSSFSSRIVNACQDGETILTMLVSYQVHEKGPFEYQYNMPDVTPFEQLTNYEDILRRLLDSSKVSDRRKTYINKVLAADIPIDIRPLNAAHYMQTINTAVEPKMCVWVKAKGHIGDDHNLHRCVAAYISDMALLRTALLPHPGFKPEMMASLDHSMWFHSHFKADEWMLYECESPRSVGARALSFGKMWNRDGTLAFTAAQEGVVRGKMTSMESKL